MLKNRQFVQLCTVLPEVEQDGIKLKHFQLTKDEVRRLQIYNFREPWYYMGMRSGYTYTKLVKDKEVWMSDTPMETNSNAQFITKANGHVLVFGLGIGLILFPLLNEEDIKSVTVVEFDKRMIDFILPKIKEHDKRGILNVIHADANDYHSAIPKGTVYDTIYFDIWLDICTDNYEHIKKLERTYRKFLNRQNPDCYMDSWMKTHLKREIAKDKRCCYW